MISEFSYFTCHHDEHGNMYDLFFCTIVQRYCAGKSAGDNSSVLFVFESCVLLHATVCFSAGDDERATRDERETDERCDRCENDSSV